MLTSIWNVPQAVKLYCSCGAAQARQWNIPNPSQPNPVREEMGHPVESVAKHYGKLATEVNELPEMDKLRCAIEAKARMKYIVS